MKEPGLKEACPLETIFLANCCVWGLVEMWRYPIIASDFQQPSSCIAFASMFAQRSAVAPPARSDRAVSSWDWIPKFVGPISVRLW
jgi:hypothetical protein